MVCGVRHVGMKEMVGDLSGFGAKRMVTLHQIDSWVCLKVLL